MVPTSAIPHINIKIPLPVEPFMIKKNPRGIKMIPAPKKGNIDAKNDAINQINEFSNPMIIKPNQAHKA